MRAWIGLLAGAAATVPMTIYMRVAHRDLPARQRYPLPPEEITAKAARRVGLAANPNRAGWEWKTYLSHFGYGASVGGLYMLLVPTRRRSLTAGAIAGAGFGLGVWTVSYLGWLPAARVLPAATREPAGRNRVMIGAHLIWGAALGLLCEAAARRSNNSRSSRRRSSSRSK